MPTTQGLASTKISMYYRGKSRDVGFPQAAYLLYIYEHREEYATQREHEEGRLTLMETGGNLDITEWYPIKGVAAQAWHEVTLALARRKILLPTEGYNCTYLAEDFDEIMAANQPALAACRALLAQIAVLEEEKEGGTQA